MVIRMKSAKIKEGIYWVGAIDWNAIPPVNGMDRKDGSFMDIYICGPCGHIYNPEEGDPDNGIAPGTPFENLPDDWVCPVCGLGKYVFEVILC